MLNATDAPLFFLWTQLMIAVVLFMISDLLRFLPDRLTFDFAVCKGLVAMVGLNVIGLRFVCFHSTPTLSANLNSLPSTKQLQQLHSQICRCLLLPSRPWALITLHSRNLMHLPPYTPIILNPHSLLRSHNRVFHRRLPEWHADFYDWNFLWRS